MAVQLDSLDIDLLNTLREQPRIGVLELSRVLQVARGTVQARIDRMEKAGVITGYGPDIDVAAAGLPVQAFVALEIAQGALDQVTEELSAQPAVLEAYATLDRQMCCAAWRRPRTRTSSKPSWPSTVHRRSVGPPVSSSFRSLSHRGRCRRSPLARPGHRVASPAYRSPR